VNIREFPRLPPVGSDALPHTTGAVTGSRGEAITG